VGPKQTGCKAGTCCTTYSSTSPSCSCSSSCSACSGARRRWRHAFWAGGHNDVWYMIWTKLIQTVSRQLSCQLSFNLCHLSLIIYLVLLCHLPFRCVFVGMAFGTGSAVAHRAVDSVMGPRETVVRHEGGEAAVDNQMATASSSGVCGDENSQFQKCLKENPGDFANCRFYFDILNQCQDNAKFQ